MCSLYTILYQFHMYNVEILQLLYYEMHILSTVTICHCAKILVITTNYNPYVVFFILMTQLFYDWKCVPLYPLHLFCPSSHSITLWRTTYALFL